MNAKIHRMMIGAYILELPNLKKTDQIGQRYKKYTAPSEQLSKRGGFIAWPVYAC
jgi:hypothetical protein